MQKSFGLFTPHFLFYAQQHSVLEPKSHIIAIIITIIHIILPEPNIDPQLLQQGLQQGLQQSPIIVASFLQRLSASAIIVFTAVIAVIIHKKKNYKNNKP